jgi:hypothetical protein
MSPVGQGSQTKSQLSQQHTPHTEDKSSNIETDNGYLGNPVWGDKERIEVNIYFI